jgi:hypothetical protein
VYRPGSAIPLLAISTAVVVFLLGDAVIRAGLLDAALLAPWPLLALWCVYVSAFASDLTVDRDAITVQNMLRVIRIPWHRVSDIQWQWQVEITSDTGERVRAIGGPVQGRGGRRQGSREQTPALARAQYDSIVRAWDAARERLASAGATTDEHVVRRNWDTPVVLALVVLAAWSVLALVVTGGPS